MMSARAAPNAETEAIDWAIRLRDSGVADWAGFTVWLEANPRNALAYDKVALADADLGLVLTAMPSQIPTPIIANDNQPGIALVQRHAGAAVEINHAAIRYRDAAWGTGGGIFRIGWRHRLIGWIGDQHENRCRNTSETQSPTRLVIIGDD